MIFDFQAGEVLLFDKPIGWTSFDVVNKVRYLIRSHLGIKKIKVGHAGTLDPLATGLLILCTGKFTKRIQEFQDQDKEYTGTFFLGATTPSFDKETEIDKTYNISHITDDKILNAAKQLTGDIEQIPPLFSAIKIKGKRAYDYARKNKDVKLNPRKVSINEFEITGIDLPKIYFRVSCSKGTYIRSLARDFGEALNAGAYLTSLCRTKSGSIDLSETMTIEMFQQLLQTPKQSDNQSIKV
jgi:tRNA pseudouridine55 synthase